MCAFTQLLSQPVGDGREFLKLESKYANIVLCFPIWYSLVCKSLWVKVCVYLGEFLKSLSFFFSRYLSSRHFSHLLSVPVSCSKIVFFPLHPTVDLFLCILNRLARKIFFRYFGRSCFMYYLTLCHCHLWLTSFANIFWSFTTSGIVRLVCCGLFVVFSFHRVLVYFSFLRTFACSQISIFVLLGSFLIKVFYFC